MNVIEPNCARRRCKHFIGATKDGGDQNVLMICQAFPTGIPDEIAYGGVPHDVPFPGDNGIVFEEGRVHESTELQKPKPIPSSTIRSDQRRFVGEGLDGISIID